MLTTTRELLASLTLGQAASLLLGLLQLGLWLLLLLASTHLLRLGLWAWRAPSLTSVDPSPAGPPPSALPVVTLQIPLRNERYVARRAIAAACALDWPAERLDIQILDDSDDDTCAIVDAAVAEQRARGHQLTVLRRRDRRGFKAGALDAALPLAAGELIAILDADFVPPVDLLHQLVPSLLADPKRAFVQGRWSFLNEDENLLTRLQALILHGLMLVEQPYLSAGQRPVQFNGTAGIWRKQVLLAAGGWMGGEVASVTEDMDLSYRVYLLGYHGRQLPEVAVPTELPATMAAFRVQQQRWVRGGAQVLRSTFLRLRHAVPTGGGYLGQRLTLLSHLLRHARQPYLSLSLLWLPLLALGWLRPAFVPPGGLSAVVAVLLMALVVYYGGALRRIGRSPLGALLLAPLLVPLSMGLALGLTVALGRGLFAGSVAAEFVRTPKTGGQPLPATSTSYRPQRDRLASLEVLLGFGYLGLAGVAAFRHELTLALGLGLLVGSGLLWVGMSSLRRTIGI